MVHAQSLSSGAVGCVQAAAGTWDCSLRKLLFPEAGQTAVMGSTAQCC